jgi:hypothetical protein
MKNNTFIKVHEQDSVAAVGASNKKFPALAEGLYNLFIMSGS